MKITFIEYPKCSTCQKAKKWLEERQVAFEDRHIVEKNPTLEELSSWVDGGLPLKKLWNTSGMKYRQLELARRLPEMSREEQLELLATDGMLVKRPVLVGEGFVLTGFRPGEWAAALGVEE